MKNSNCNIKLLRLKGFYKSSVNYILLFHLISYLLIFTFVHSGEGTNYGCQSQSYAGIVSV